MWQCCLFVLELTCKLQCHINVAWQCRIKEDHEASQKSKKARANPYKTLLSQIPVTDPKKENNFHIETHHCQSGENGHVRGFLPRKISLVASTTP